MPEAHPAGDMTGYRTPGYPRRESHEVSMLSQDASREVCADILMKDFWKESFCKTGNL